MREERVEGVGPCDFGGVVVERVLGFDFAVRARGVEEAGEGEGEGWGGDGAEVKEGEEVHVCGRGGTAEDMDLKIGDGGEERVVA